MDSKVISAIQYGLTRTQYQSFRAHYLPADRKIVFVLESPPKSGLYFYNPEGRVSEPLFSAMMTCLSSNLSPKMPGCENLHAMATY